MTSTAAIQEFQKRIHAMESARSRELRMSDQEARNLNREISILLAKLAETQSKNDTTTEVQIVAERF